MCRDCSCGQPVTAPPPTTTTTTPPPPRSTPAAQGPIQPRALPLESRLLQRNDDQAAGLRKRFRSAGVRVVNLLSSPGSGKTALLEALARRLAPRWRLAAIVGDLATDHDARRLQGAGLAAVQITTGQACHLEAAMVAEGLHRLSHQGIALDGLDLLLIENVGNLVCPAGYDLGEDQRLVLLAVGEGEDKPLKYAPTFQSADLVVITKMDLAEAVGFDGDAARAAIARVAPRARCIATSARSGEGLDSLIDALLPAVPQPRSGP